MAALRVFVFTFFLSQLLITGSISDVEDEPRSNGMDPLSSKIRTLGNCHPKLMCNFVVCVSLRFHECSDSPLFFFYNCFSENVCTLTNVNCYTDNYG